jgi:hypothetical protein
MLITLGDDVSARRNALSFILILKLDQALMAKKVEPYQAPHVFGMPQTIKTNRELTDILRCYINYDELVPDIKPRNGNTMVVKSSWYAGLFGQRVGWAPSLSPSS